MNHRFTLNGMLSLSLICTVIAAVVVLPSTAAIVSSIFKSGYGDNQPMEEWNVLLASHTDRLTEWQERFNGRSVFFKPPRPYRPPPPPPPPPPERKKKKEPVEPPPPSGPPTRYGGPSIIYVFGDVVRFMPKSANGMPFDVYIGEEVDGIHVIETKLPTAVRVGWKGGEYDVKVFEHEADESKYFLEKSPATQVIPGIIEVESSESPALDAPIDTQTSASVPDTAPPVTSQTRTPRRSEVRQLAGRAVATPVTVENESDAEDVIDDSEEFVDDEEFEEPYDEAEDVEYVEEGLDEEYDEESDYDDAEAVEDEEDLPPDE